MKLPKLLANHVKTLQELPCLKKTPILGHGHLFLPTGKYKTEKLTEGIEDMYHKLGTIFTLNLGGMDIVVTLDADHTREMYRNEGKFPVRPPFPALIKYRQETFNSVGVVPGNGPEWYHFRNGINPLLNPQLIVAYADRITQIAHKFINYVDEKRDGNWMLENMFSHYLLFAIQAISIISPGVEFDCLSFKEVEKGKQIVNCSIDFMESLYETLIGLPLWKYFPTKSYRKLSKAHNTIHSIILNHLHEKQQDFQENPKLFAKENPFLNSLYANPHLKLEDCVMLAVETFLGGIDATATTLSFATWFLARNKAIQEKARKDLSNKYLKMCLKETLRMRATAGANSRFIINDVHLDDYLIPKGTLIMSFVSAMSMCEKYFENPTEFHPERWSKIDGKSDIHPYSSLPFGFGPRMCPGRRVAEFEIVILLRNILNKYQLSVDSDEEIGMVYRMNRIPEKPINVTFHDFL